MGLESGPGLGLRSGSELGRRAQPCPRHLHLSNASLAVRAASFDLPIWDLPQTATCKQQVRGLRAFVKQDKTSGMANSVGQL